MNKRNIAQGEVYMVDLSIGTIEHEQKGIRPCIILQNNYLNNTSDNVVIVPLTSQKKKSQPFHYVLKRKDYPFLTRDKSIVLMECIICISKKRLERKIGSIHINDMNNIIDTIKYVWTEKQ